MSTAPLFLSPATPSEIAIYASTQCVYPTTLVICTSKAEFDYALNEDIAQVLRLHNPGLPREQDDNEERHPDNDDPTDPQKAVVSAHVDQDMYEEDQNLSMMPEPNDNTDTPTWVSPLLQQSIHRIAIAEHIRVVFMPSVSHLRAWLTVLPPPEPDVVRPPPPPATSTHQRKSTSPPALLLLYGFLDLHRDTSEWSAQGLGNSASTLVEAARHAALRAVVVEPRMEWHDDALDMNGVLTDEVPMLSGAERRAVTSRDQDEGGSGGWIGRTVSVERVMGRWFRFQEGPWDALRQDHDAV